MSSGSDFEEEYQPGGKSKGSGKRKRGRQAESESEDDFSLDEEPDWDEEDDAAAKPKKKKAAGKRGRPAGKAAASNVELDEEALVEDEEDRERLAKMTEFEREMILSERAEKRLQELQRQQLLQSAEGGDDEEKPAKRRGAARRSGREVREETAKKSAIQELKAARERKAQGRKAHTADDIDRAGEDEDDEEMAELGAYDDEDYEVEEGQADEGPGGLRWEPREDEEDEEMNEEADFEELKSIQVRRHKLEEWFDKPHFASTLPGVLVRVIAGERRNAEGQIVLDVNGRPQSRYMMVQVVGIEEVAPGYHKYMEGTKGGWKSPYVFGPKGVKTNLWLKVSRGQSERIWPLAQVSNKPITPEEHSSWHKACEGARRQITRGEVAEMHKRLQTAENYLYTAEDVAKLLEEKRNKGQGARNIALERARLERERDFAAENNDEARLAEIQAEIEALENVSQANLASRQGIAASMAKLNKKNADKNFQTAFKAGKDAGAAAGGAAGAAATLDPFSRRVTRTKNYWNTKRVGADDDGAAAEDLAAAQTELEAAEAAAVAAAKAAKAAEQAEVTLVDLSGLDLSLLDLPSQIAPIARKLLGSGAAAGVGVAMGNGRVPAGAPTVTLAEYKRRNGR